MTIMAAGNMATGRQALHWSSSLQLISHWEAGDSQGDSERELDKQSQGDDRDRDWTWYGILKSQNHP